jgi:hypothetical protein
MKLTVYIEIHSAGIIKKKPPSRDNKKMTWHKARPACTIISKIFSHDGYSSSNSPEFHGVSGSNIPGRLQMLLRTRRISNKSSLKGEDV